MTIRLDDLKEADALREMSVGDSRRATHGDCGRNNASCTRTPVGWLMHCFKCGDKGFKISTHANPTYNVAPFDSKSKPSRLVPDNFVSPSTPKYVESLHKIGLTYTEAKAYHLDVSAAPFTSRVWFPLHSLMREEDCVRAVLLGYKAGKAYDGAELTRKKWDVLPPFKGDVHLDKGELVYAPFAYADRTSFSTPGNAIVLVEDPISALKIDSAMSGESGPRVLCIAMLGLSMGEVLLELVGRFNGPVILWADGDGPGMLRGKKLSEQIRFLRQDKRTIFHYIRQKDPKHLLPSDIRREIDCLLEEVNDRPADMEAVSSAHP